MMIQLREALMIEGQGVVSLVGAGGKTTLMFKLAHEIAKKGEPVLTTTTTKIVAPGEGQSSCLILSDSAETIVSKAKGLLNKHNLHITAAADQQQEEEKLIGLPPDTINAIYETKLFRWIVVEADGAARKPLKAPAEHEPVIPNTTSRVVGIAGLSGVGKPLTEKWIHRPERFEEITGLAAGAAVTEAAVGDIFVHEKGIFKGAPAQALRIAFLNQADVPGACEAGKTIAGLLSNIERTGLKRIVIGQTKLEPPVVEYYEVNS
jgi:probable selenium-dependent hydroxylase accessory protein YqeC